MSLFACSLDGLRHPGKLCTVYWAWFVADGSRVAYKQRLCVPHYAQFVLPLEVEADTPTLTCPMCHASTVEDMDPTYATVCVPGAPKVNLDLPTCAPCAAHLRVRAQEGASKLPDREEVAGSSLPTPLATGDAWAEYRRTLQ